MSECQNPQKALDLLLADPDTMGKSLCLHSCCAPCSSYCLLYLSAFFKITVFYYNPNITEEAEFAKRAREQQRLIGELNRFAEAAKDAGGADAAALWEHTEPPAWKACGEGGAAEKSGKAALYAWIRDRLLAPRYEISYREGSTDPEAFFSMAKGLEREPERGARCRGCYSLRLSETARFAKEEGDFSYFATTLTLSPLKDAAAINQIGTQTGKNAGVSYLATDFKKKNGYLYSILLSELFSLYRQDYCGCVFSKEARFAVTAAPKEA